MSTNEENADIDAFTDTTAEDDALQDIDDADPSAPLKPAFADDYSDTQADERAREERGNRGPEEEPGFGQGA